MSYFISNEMKEMMRPGVCTFPGCEKFETSRNSIGRCVTCHNREYFERKETERLAINSGRNRGSEYWLSRDIKLGEKLVTHLSSVFMPMGEDVYGIAKIGRNGAYVLSHKTKCYPEGWRKIS
jgi:hypothetical protein